MEYGQPFELTVAVHHLPDELLFMSGELRRGEGRIIRQVVPILFLFSYNSTAVRKNVDILVILGKKNRLPYCQVFLFLIWLPVNRFHKNVVFNWSVPSITVMPKKIRKNLWNKTFDTVICHLFMIQESKPSWELFCNDTNYQFDAWIW